MKRYIKLNLLNGDIIRTYVNGTEEEIVKQYIKQNFLKSCTYDEYWEQVERLEFLDVFKFDLNCSSLVYLFADYGHGFYEVAK